MDILAFMKARSANQNLFLTLLNVRPARHASDGIRLFMTKKTPRASEGLFFYLAGAERLELPTPGFGDRCSTN